MWTMCSCQPLKEDVKNIMTLNFFAWFGFYAPKDLFTMCP